ncbi:phospholipase D-like domain-containing protein [Pseudomonas syringae pv. actinidiae]|nr:phospholipase D-like domain-containing protein [Pseudomonas syringae pv. actinidiae]
MGVNLYGLNLTGKCLAYDFFRILYPPHAGITLRTNDHYKIQHDKVVVIDANTVQTGSFNYTASAERSNSENVVVMWNVPDVAKAYLSHWQSRWDQGKPYASSY